MKYCLWTIKDYFTDIIAEYRITGKDSDIEQFRLLDPSEPLEDRNLYIGFENQFPGLKGSEAGSRIALCCGPDYLILNTQNLAYAANRLMAMRQYFENWEERCRQSVQQGRSLHALLDLAEEVLHKPLLIIDSSQYLFAYSAGYAAMDHIDAIRYMLDNKSLPESTLKQFNHYFLNTFTARTSFFIPDGIFPTASLCHNIFLNDELAATLILVSDPEETPDASKHVFEQVVPFVHKWIESNRSEDSENYFNSSLARLLDGNTDSIQTLERGLSTRGWSENCPKCLIAAAAVSEQFHFDAYLSKTISLRYPGICGIQFQKKIIFLCNLEMSSEQLPEQLRSKMEEHLYYGASSVSFTRLQHIPEALSQVLSILEKSTPAAGRIYDFQENAVRYLTGLHSRTALPILHPLIRQLRDYDSANHTEYYKTLFCYLKNERSQQLTSKELFIHRNTLILRLGKIQNIWNPDLDNAEERFYLLYSFYHEEYQKD